MRNRKRKVKPIKPDEIVELKKVVIPTEVIETVNILLAQKFCNGYATILQEDIVDALIVRTGWTSDFIFDNNYLDFEDIYREAGWKVVYDKPGFNEDYDKKFHFSKG